MSNYVCSVEVACSPKQKPEDWLALMSLLVEKVGVACGTALKSSSRDEAAEKGLWTITAGEAVLVFRGSEGRMLASLKEATGAGAILAALLIVLSESKGLLKVTGPLAEPMSSDPRSWFRFLTQERELFRHSCVVLGSLIDARAALQSDKRIVPFAI